MPPATPRPRNWLLHREAAQTGSTFLTPAIRDHARQALLFREPGALWNEDRLWANLLSSQALTLNLLAPLATDLALASRVWRRLLPGFIQDVTALASSTARAGSTMPTSATAPPWTPLSRVSPPTARLPSSPSS